MLSRVQLFATPWTVTLAGSSVHGISQARILEWVAISFSRGSSQPWIELGSPALQADSLLTEPARKLPFYIILFNFHNNHVKNIMLRKREYKVK